MKNLLRGFDLLSEPINLTYGSTKNKNTTLGGILTICVLTIIIYYTINFGIDIINKEKPNVIVYQKFLKESQVFLKDFPIVFYFTNAEGKTITDIDKYTTFNVKYYEWYTNGTDYLSKINTLFVERCTDEHFKKLPEKFMKNLPIINELYCLNMLKIKYENGTINTNDTTLHLKNEFGSDHSNGLRIDLYECDPLKDNKICYPEKERRDLLKDFNMVHFLKDFYIDIDYDEPIKPYAYSFSQSIDFGMTKELKIKIKTVEFNTDSGFLMEEFNNFNLNQLMDMQTENKFGKDYLYSLSFGSTRIQDVYYRKYLKINDLMAQIGGLINVLFIIGQFVCSKYSHLMFIIDLSSSIFVKIVEKDIDKVQIHRIAQFKDVHSSELQLQISNINQLNNICNPSCNFISTPLKTTLYDYLKSKCNRKSNYDKQLYESIHKFVNNHLNILYITKQFIKLNKFIDIFSKDCEFKQCLAQKLNINTYNFSLMDNNLINNPELLVRQLQYQEKLNVLLN